MKDNKILHKLGEAIISDQAAELIESWQGHNNDSLDGHVTEILKAVSFIAIVSEATGSDDYKHRAMQHVVSLSGIAEELETFRK